MTRGMPTGMDFGQGITSTVRSTLSAVIGGVGNLFDDDGALHAAELVIDEDAELPGGTELFAPGRRVAAFVKHSAPHGSVEFRTLCIKVADCYGPGRDQDVLLASSADGVPFHHAVLPAERLDSRLYSSLWLYLAGLEPIVLGARARTVAHADALTAGDRFDFLVGSAVGRFRPIGRLVIEQRVDDAVGRFSGSNAGGGLRALPPVSFYGT